MKKQVLTSKKFARDDLIGLYDLIQSGIESDIKSLTKTRYLSQCKEMKVSLNLASADLEKIILSKVHYRKNIPRVFVHDYIKVLLDAVLYVPLGGGRPPVLVFKRIGEKLNSLSLKISPDNFQKTQMTFFNHFIYWDSKLITRFPSQIKKKYSKKFLDSLYLGEVFYPEGVYEFPISLFRTSSIRLDGITKHVKQALKDIEYITINPTGRPPEYHNEILDIHLEILKQQGPYFIKGKPHFRIKDVQRKIADLYSTRISIDTIRRVLKKNHAQLLKKHSKTPA